MELLGHVIGFGLLAVAVVGWTLAILDEINDGGRRDE